MCCFGSNCGCGNNRSNRCGCDGNRSRCGENRFGCGCGNREDNNFRCSPERRAFREGFREGYREGFRDGSRSCWGRFTPLGAEGRSIFDDRDCGCNN